MEDRGMKINRKQTIYLRFNGDGLQWSGRGLVVRVLDSGL